MVNNHPLRRTAFFIALFLAILAATVATALTISDDSRRAAFVSQTTGLTSLAFLYATLLISPLSLAFPRLPFRKTLFQSRRGLGISSFAWAAVHASVAFVFQLGAFDGLGYLASNEFFAVAIAALAFFILFVLTLTANERSKLKLGRVAWKTIHRFVYLAGILVLVHVALIGSHFQAWTGPISFTALVALFALAWLQSFRLDAWLERRFSLRRSFGPSFVATTALVVFVFVAAIAPANPNHGHRTSNSSPSTAQETP